MWWLGIKLDTANIIQLHKAYFLLIFLLFQSQNYANVSDISWHQLYDPGAESKPGDDHEDDEDDAQVNENHDQWQEILKRREQHEDDVWSQKQTVD